MSLTSAWRQVSSGAGLAPLTLVSVLAVVGAAAGPGYAGTIGPYLLFHAASILLAGSIFLPPFSYGFTALSLFVLLGFWVKLVALIFGAPVLIEPTGRFDGSAEWADRGLLFAAAGLGGLALARVLLYLLVSPARHVPRDISVPGWYRNGRRVIWATTCVAVIAGSLANWRFRFYMVGAHELLVLPFPLNAALGWWYTVGASLWIAALLDWERRIDGDRSFARWLLVPLAEALITSIVTLSRGAYLMKTLPYVFVVTRRASRQQLHLRRPTTARLLGVAALGFLVSLAGVSWLRMVTYPTMVLPSTPLHGETGSSSTRRAAGKRSIDPAGNSGLVPTAAVVEARVRELGRMILGRWIGLEGVLAVAGASHLGSDLLLAAVAEDPRTGNLALYQQISRAEYKPTGGFTFLTVPGVVAVLAFSGSYLAIVLGMCLAGSVLLGTEVVIRRVFQNDFLCGVAGVAAANALAQMNFPYLTLVFFVELLLTLAALWMVQRHRQTRPVGDAWPPEPIEKG